METSPRKPYLSDVSDDEWALVAPYLTLTEEAAPQSRLDHREVFNYLRYLVRSGLQWRLLPNDLPPWPAVYQETRRWMLSRVLMNFSCDRFGHSNIPENLQEIVTGKWEAVSSTMFWSDTDHSIMIEITS